MTGRDRDQALRIALAIAVSLTLWATAFVGIRYAIRSYAPGPAALLRFLAASAAFAAWPLLAPRRLAWPGRRDLARLALAGLVGNAVYHLSLNHGQPRVTAAVSSVLVATSPVFTALLARALLGERVGARGWLGIAVAFCGTVMIAAREGSVARFEPAAGFVLVAALAQAAAFILVKPVLDRAPAFTTTAVTVWSGTVWLSPFAGALAADVASAPPSATAALVYLGLFPGFAGALAFAYVLARMPASRAAPLLYAVPPLTLLLAWALLGERPPALAIAGGVVTLAGVALIERPASTAEAERARKRA